MPEEDTGTQETESSAVEDEVTPESSAGTQEEAEDQETETPQEEEVPFHKHPRWQQVQDRLHRAEEIANEHKARAERLEQALLDKTKPQSPQEDPYEGLSQEERRFYQNLDKRYSGMLEKEMGRREARMMEEFERREQAILAQQGKVMAQQFLKDNPEVKPGSFELKEIVRIASEKKIDLEDAKKIVMYDFNAKKAVMQQKKKQTEKTKEKMQANLETGTVPRKSTIGSEPESFEDAFDAAAKEVGIEF